MKISLALDAPALTPEAVMHEPIFRRGPWRAAVWLSALGLMIFGGAAARANEPGGGTKGPDVTLFQAGKDVTLSNGIVTVVVDTSAAQITAIKFKGRDLLGAGGKGNVYFSRDGGTDYEQLPHCVYSVTKKSPDMADISCKHIYTPGLKDKHAWDVDVHFVLRRGMTGLYVYTINSHPASYPEMDVGEWRMVWPMPVANGEYLLEKVYIDPPHNLTLPRLADYRAAQPVPGAPKEVTKFVSGSWNGKYDCKYVWVADYWDIGCWGYASDRNHLGEFYVFGSDEFFTNGPMKQDLTATQSAINLVHLNMNHFGGTALHFPAGTEWHKIYGPYLMYFTDQATGDACWKDAQEQAKVEAAAWPYAWLDNPAYPPAKQRGTVSGKFVVADALKPDVSGANAWVGIALPENSREGGFQFQGEYYQYWVHADADGNFKIPNIRPGNYTLYAFTTGAVGEFSKNVTVKAGDTLELGDVTWAVPHKGKTIAWEIGIPDRRATEFKHGDEYFVPMLFWQFPKEFPNPLEYYVGKSDYHKDWNYAQSYYYNGNQQVPHRWRIHFNLDRAPTENATLTLALAGSHQAAIDVYVNSDSAVKEHLVPKFQGGNALVRESDHAKYEVDYVTIPAGLLHKGANTLSLVQTNVKSDQSSVMYDYLSLEL
ncbi:MAG TPA: polysaccharide lyase family protein [Opitutales bacterium]|nr:polysaccharide lyase family protein [Opitutales bacterium]